MGLFSRKKYSGFTKKTAENLLLDAGAFFVNYDVKQDTFDTAKNKLLGATRGGGQFSAIPEVRRIEVDGVAGSAKGLTVIDSWEVKMSANLLEVSEEALSKALISSDVDTGSNETYNIIKARNFIELEDYIDNITFIGTLSGSLEPVIIQVYNALSVNGLTLQTQSKNEAVIAMELEGHYDTNDLDNPPFAIYYPKRQTDTEATVTPISATFDLYESSQDNRDIEFTVTGATVTKITLNNSDVDNLNYTIIGSKVTFLKSYLETLGEETHAFKLETASKTLTVTIEVVDTE